MKAEEGMMERVYVLVATHKVCKAHSERVVIKAGTEWNGTEPIGTHAE